MELTAEVIECADGMLNFLWEGNKLAAVSFQHAKGPRMARGGVVKVIDQIESACERCTYCRTWVDYRNGSWYDFADHFLCADSPSSMHNASL